VAVGWLDAQAPLRTELIVPQRSPGFRRNDIAVSDRAALEGLTQFGFIAPHARQQTDGTSQTEHA
jgi:hypothetical protein